MASEADYSDIEQHSKVFEKSVEEIEAKINLMNEDLERVIGMMGQIG